MRIIPSKTAEISNSVVTQELTKKSVDGTSRSPQSVLAAVGIKRSETLVKKLGMTSEEDSITGACLPECRS